MTYALQTKKAQADNHKLVRSLEELPEEVGVDKSTFGN